MKRSVLWSMVALSATLAFLSGCSKKTPVQQVPEGNGTVTEKTLVAQATAAAPKKEAQQKMVDFSKQVELKFNLAYGNKNRTMTFNQSTPMTLANGDVITAGMLKPMWREVEKKFNVKINDVGIQDAKSPDMINTESTSGFTGANIYGGSNVATQLMGYGAQGYFTNLSELMEQGYMPHFKAYLDANPNVRKAITCYDGNIYFIPYIAEIGTIGRTFCIRGSWVSRLLDGDTAAFDTDAFTTYVKPFYVGAKARTGANGGTVTPKEGVSITKKTAEDIVEIQNALPIKNGKTLADALISYIKRNYDYENPSELFLGEKAAYDVDELVALYRVIKANPKFLTDGKADQVWPYFARQASFREELIRMGTYYDGVKVHGSDSYSSRWMIDKDGQVEYTYSMPEVYDLLCKLSDWQAEGLIYSDMMDLSNKGNFRSALWGTDSSDKPRYGFMTYDFIASSTADALNPDVITILPPVAKVNGVWQYYMDNSRVIKSDGWALSKAGTQEQIERAAAVMDYFFTDEGHLMQNYGLLDDIASTDGYLGPDGKKWPLYKDWTPKAAALYQKGDLSSFLRDWVGCQMAIGYQKEIGFEYQYTSQRGFDAWKLLTSSTLTIPTYAGDGPKGDNPYYYTLTPPAYSLTPRQSEIIKKSTSIESEDVVEMMFNVIRYKSLHNAPSGATVPQNYDEYLQYFKSKGLDSYVSTIQAAYEVMKDSN